MKPFQNAVPIAAATLLLVSGALGQRSNVTVTACVRQFNWTLNANRQTPCYVASQLHSACGVNVSYDAIPRGTLYTGPNVTSVNACGCNSVVYALASACGACQGRNWTRAINWFSNCPEGRYYSTFPQGRVPSGLDVPRWARLGLDQMANQTWDPRQAETFASNQPLDPSTSITSGPNPSSSISTGAVAPISSGANSTENGSNNLEGEPQGRSHAGAIAGGVVGGLIGLVAVGVGIFIWITRRRGRKIQHLDLTEQDTFAAAAGGPHADKGSNASWRKPGVPNSSTPPPVMSEKADSRVNHARHPSSASASSENRTHIHERKAASSPVYGMHRPQRSIDSLSKFSAGGHTTSDHRVVTPTGYTGAAEPYR